MANLFRSLKEALRRGRKRSNNAISTDVKNSPSSGFASLPQPLFARTQSAIPATDVASAQVQEEPVGFLALPGELRNLIYEIVLISPKFIELQSMSEHESSSKVPGLLQTNQQVREEASSIYFLNNQFLTNRLEENWTKPFFPMEAFLKQTGACQYGTSLLVHCEIPNVWRPMPFPNSWEELVDRASRSWMPKSKHCNIKVAFPMPFDPFDFELFAVLVVGGMRYRDALLTVNFRRWLIKKQIRFEWGMSMTQDSLSKPYAVALARFGPPGSKPATPSGTPDRRPRTRRWLWSWRKDTFEAITPWMAG